MKKILSSIFVAVIIIHSASAQTISLKPGSVLHYDVNSSDGNHQYYMTIKTVAPDLSYSWIDSAATEVKTGDITITAVTMKGTKWDYYPVSDDPHKVSVYAKLLLPAALYAEVDSMFKNPAKAKPIDDGDGRKYGSVIEDVSDDLKINGKPVNQLPLYVLTETVAANGMPVEEDEGVEIDVLQNAAFPIVIWYDGSAEGSMSYELLEIRNADVK